MNVLPIGTPVWVAQAADPDAGRRAVTGDGTVTSHLPCGVCWQWFVSRHRRPTPATAKAAAAQCTNPAGFVVTAGRRPIAITDGDPTVIVVPITSDEWSAA